MVNQRKPPAEKVGADERPSFFRLVANFLYVSLKSEIMHWSASLPHIVQPQSLGHCSGSFPQEALEI